MKTLQMKHITIVYTGNLVQVIQKSSLDGQKILECARRAPGVRLIIPTETGYRLNYEYRSSLQSNDYRLPGGKVFDTWQEYEKFLNETEAASLIKDEALIEAARNAAIREGIEEQGIVINPEHLEFLGISRCGTTMEWDLYYFLVTSFIEGKQALEDDEIIEVREVESENVINLCLSEEFSEHRSALMLMKYHLNKK